MGLETAQALKVTGAHIYATARSLPKDEAALAGMLKPEKPEPGKLNLMHLDLNSLESVRSFAGAFLQTTGGKLNILINNAGVMATPEGTTVDGFDTQFGANHLAHFLLFQLLKPALLASTTSTFHSRVVRVSSIAHRHHSLDFDNIMLSGGEYQPNRAYAHSKLANIYMANEIERRYGARGLHALSLNLGGIASGLRVNIKEDMDRMLQVPHMAQYMKRTEQGAATTVWAAVGRCWEGKGGEYLEDC